MSPNRARSFENEFTPPAPQRGHYDLDGVEPPSTNSVYFQSGRASPAQTLKSRISEENKKVIATQLSRLLGDSYFLYLKTQNFHWNVVGPSFNSLHKLFEHQYKELAEAIDVIAERIRALGYTAPGSFREFTQISSIKEVSDKPSAEQMIRILCDDHETVIASIQETFEKISEFHDLSTEDLLAARSMIHEKNAWILRSLLA